jgi:enamine deaminase RidA (YjgF/YER057c/UK114 family)
MAHVYVTDKQKQCITNLGEVLKAAGSSINSIVKVNVFLADMDDFAAMNEVYEQVLPHRASG